MARRRCLGGPNSRSTSAKIRADRNKPYGRTVWKQLCVIHCVHHVRMFAEVIVCLNAIFPIFRIGSMRARVCSAFDLFLYPVAKNIRVLIKSITSISAIFAPFSGGKEMTFQTPPTADR